MTLIPLWIAVLSIISPAEGSTTPISVDTKVTQREVTIGDPVTYSIIVRHDPEIEVTPPDPTPNFEGFELESRETKTSRDASGQVVETFQFHLRADRVAHYTLPPVPVHFSVPDAKHPGERIPGKTSAPQAVIVVNSVLYREGEPKDIHEIKPILGAAPDWRKYLTWVLGGLVALALFAWIIRSLAKPRQSSVPSTAASETPPHVIAFRELNALLAKQLLEQGRIREHYFELSEIFRRYLGARFGFPALDWTTEEITAYLSRQPSEALSALNTVPELLRNTDRVKFARAPIDLETARNDLLAVRRFVELTMPREDTAIPSTAREATGL